MKDHYRMVSWWLRKDDLPWPNRNSAEKFRRRAACMAREGVNAAIVFGAHFRWDFMPVTGQLHELIAFVADELHQYGIVLFDHHSSVLSCNYNPDPRRFNARKTYSNHRQMLISPPDGFLPREMLDEWKMKDAGGRNVFYPQYAAQSFCMNNPDFREAYYAYLKRLVADTAIDGLMSDDAIFPLSGCFCPFCCARFRREYGLEYPPAGDFSFWRNRDNPDYRAMIRMRLDSVRDYFRGVTASLPRNFPLMSCCASSIHPALLERGLTYGAFIEAGANTVMLEMCGNTPDAGGALFRKELPSQLLHLAMAEDSGLPCIGLGYGFSSDAAFMVWAFNKFLNSGTWYSSLVHRLGLSDQDMRRIPDDPEQLDGIFRFEEKHAEWFHAAGAGDVAVLFPCDTVANFGGMEEDCAKDYSALCMYLLEHGFSADVVTDVPDAGSRWKVLLVPSAVCVAEEKYAAMKRWTDAGKTAVVLGPFGFRTASGAPAEKSFASRCDLPVSFPEKGRGSLCDPRNAALPPGECTPEGVFRPYPGFHWFTRRFSSGVPAGFSAILEECCTRLHAEGWASRRYVDPAGRLLVHFIALEYCIALNESLEKRRNAHSPAFRHLKIISHIAPKHGKPLSMTMPEGFSRVELLEPYSRREPRELSMEELRSIPLQPGCPYFLLRFHPAR